jgi:flavin-binding protein dodecin
MTDSVYKVIELIGTSAESWEKAALAAVAQAARSLRDLRIAEIKELDLQLDDDGSVVAYRAKVRISFRYHGEENDD